MEKSNEKFGDLNSGENMNVGTTTFNLSNVNGVQAGDVTSAKLFCDIDDNGIVNSSSTDWSKVSQITAGTIASDGTTTIDFIYSMINVNSTLYIGTNEASSAEVYKYNYEGQINGYGKVAISGTTGTITFATSSTYTISTTTDFLIELTVTNLETGTGGETTPAFRFEGSSKLEGSISFDGDMVEGESGTDNDTMIMDYSTVESSNCNLNFSGNPDAVTHEKQ